MKTLLNKAGEQLHKFISNGGWITILVFAFFGILFAVVGHYGTMGFNWKWFLFFELPLYAFCGWALYKVFKLIKHNPDVFKYSNNNYYGRKLQPYISAHYAEYQTHR